MNALDVMVSHACSNSLELFTDISIINKNILITDIEDFFVAVELRDDFYTRLVLENVEKGKYLNKNSFTDRFGFGLKSDCLSSGAKLLLSIYYYPEYVFLGDEMGSNCLDILIKCKSGKVLFNRHGISFCDFPSNGVLLNNISIHSLSELNYLLSIGGFPNEN